MSQKGNKEPPHSRSRGQNLSLPGDGATGTGRESHPAVVRAVCACILLAVALTFGKTLLYDFVNLDDAQLVSENLIVQRGVTAQGAVWACTTAVAKEWYPLTWISYMLDRQMYGPRPWGYHWTNVLLHAASSVVLFLVLRRMTGNLWAGAFAALVFAIHPLQAESVAWVSERNNLLSGLFFVLTIAVYVAYASRPFSLPRYLAVAGLFTLGLLAKPTLVTLPCVLLLLDYWPLRRWQGAGSRELGTGDKKGKGEREKGRTGDALLLSTVHRSPSTSLLRLVVEKIPLLLLSAACCVVQVLSHTGNFDSLESVPISARIANALISYAVYIGQFFWPVGLAPFYPRHDDFPARQVASACLVLAVISVAALMSWRKQPAVLVGWLWYLGTLVPVIGLVQYGRFARADRYAYLSQIGLCITVVWGVSWGLERFWHDGRSRCWLYAAGGTLAVAGLMSCAWQQTSYWQDSETLWTHTLACTSRNWLAHYSLGTALADRGDVDAAIDHFRKALKIRPDFVEVHNDLGDKLAERGEVDEAMSHFRTALEIDPNSAAAHNNLGAALAGRGEVDSAIDHYQKALEIKPDFVEAHNNFGAALAGCGRLDEAIDHFRKALEINPGSAGSHNNLGSALARSGRLEEAITHFRKALEINPDDVQARNNLGTAVRLRQSSAVPAGEAP